ncbi:MAG TPA: PilZ domain-containing protein [Candidatus Acidoferrales bacterium]|nr:PilZ domain-containing protein [Candidatus Acidoferrales bacterium]
MTHNNIKERRRYDRETKQEQERRRFERLELRENAYLQDEHGRRLGIVSHVSGGGLRVFLENDEQLGAFMPEQQRALTVVEENGTRTNVHVRVVYVNDYDVGLEFV